MGSGHLQGRKGFHCSPAVDVNGRIKRSVEMTEIHYKDNRFGKGECPDLIKFRLKNKQANKQTNTLLKTNQSLLSES